MKTPALALALFLAAAPAAHAEEERPPMTVDRPSFGNGSRTVGDGTVQLEAGIQVTTYREGGPALVNLPQRLRVGTGEDVEFRLDTTLFQWQGDVSGLADMAPGFKWNLHADEGSSYALLGSLQVPSGARAFRAPEAVPALSVIGEWPLGDTTLIVNAGASSPYDAAASTRLVQPFGTLYLSRALGDGVGGYVELAGFGPAAVGAPSTAAVDGGVSFQVDPDTAVDFAVFKGLSGTGLDWAGTVGASFRW